MTTSVAKMSQQIARFVHTVSWIDWAVSILLVAVIVIIAVWVCQNARREDGASNAAELFSCGGSSSEQTDEEPFAGESGPIVVTSVSHMKDGVKDDEIGCCLVFYEGCGHCQAFKGTWKKVCAELHGKVKNGKRFVLFESGDVHDKTVWQSVSEWLGIGGYPTILVKEGGKDAEWREYNGSRTKLKGYLESLA